MDYSCTCLLNVGFVPVTLRGIMAKARKGISTPTFKFVSLGHAMPVTACSEIDLTLTVNRIVSLA